MRMFLILLSTVLAGSAFAMDPGTYRPGQPYHSSQAQSANACAAQCQNDGQCKGWNFVKITPSAPVGICEYNTHRAAPVSSSVSISGDSIAGNRTTTQLVSGGTRTLRIGAPTAYQPSQNALSTPTSSTRRIVSQPIPQNRPVQQTGYTAVSVKRPVHALDTLPQKTQPITKPAAKPRLRHSLEATAPIRSQVQTAPAPRHIQPQLERRPGPASDMKKVQTQPNRLPLPKVEPRVTAPKPAPTAVQVPTRVSLYGSLHDDVKIPRPLTSRDIPTDENAPIATVSSVPTQKIMQEKLDGMAGPARR